MGTRALTIFVSNEFGEPHPVCAMYRQCDGYLDGHGKELKEFLTGFQIVNGMNGREGPKYANGAGCLAAQVVAHFKTHPGHIYMHSVPTDPNDPKQREAYNYTVTTKSKEPIWLTVDYYGKKTLYDGPLEGFNPEMQESDDDE